MTLDEYRNNLEPYNQRIFDGMYDCFVETAIQLLLEADTKDDTIITTIKNHWNIPNDEITNILHNEKIKATLDSLKRYMQQSGYSETEINDFLQENVVSTKLRNEHDLLSYRKNPEKLYKSVQKKKKSKEK